MNLEYPGIAAPRVTSIRQNMIDDMTVRRMAEGTQQQYLSACARFIAFHQGKPPGLLGPDHVKSYQVHLVREKQLAWSTLNIHVCALRFLFCVTLGREWAVKHIVYPKLPKKLPVVLSLEEVEQFLEPIGNIKHRAMFVLAYATGLRLMEVATLKISNIDSRRMVIHVENGKGGKDRYVMLAPSLLLLLREYYKAVRPVGWLFSGASPEKHITGGCLGKACQKAWQASGLAKKVTVHTLRHTFATVLRALVQCRTAALEGHVQECDQCCHQHIAYNSCRNRHCPKCQSLARARWLQDRKSELLPVEYFHVVFTVPATIAAVALQNQSVVYNILFRAVGQTLKRIGADPQHLGAEIGYLAVLHTWGQNLSHHPHVHCVVPGGGLSPDGNRWLSCRKGFFLPVRVLSRLFRGVFLNSLRKAHAAGELRFSGKLQHLAEPQAFSGWLARHRKTDWVVYSKRPFAGPEQVLEYLGRYTHRVAISNQRLQNVTESEVTFRWKDYRNGDQHRVMRLEPHEFVRRFLQHVLPSGFVRIRHGGFLGNSHRHAKLARCRELLQVPAPKVEPTDWKTLFEKLMGRPVDLCRACNQGRLVCVEVIPRERLHLRLWWRPPVKVDSS